jgi:hypothetical protein
MDATTERVAVEREIEIAASAETVWSYLVDPEKITRWWGTDAELDPRGGGAWRVEISGQRIARGELLEIDDPDCERDDGARCPSRCTGRRGRACARGRLAALPRAPCNRCQRRRSGPRSMGHGRDVTTWRTASRRAPAGP